MYPNCFASDLTILLLQRFRGEYFVPYTKLAKPNAKARNEQLGKELWALSEALVREKTGKLA